MKFIDVHAHIQQHDSAELGGILQRAAEASVGAIVIAGVTVVDSRRCVELASQYPQLLAGVGVHPTDLTGPLTAADVASLDEMAADRNVVVMSEVGIDHQQHVLERPTPGGASWVDIQAEAFQAQIGIARKHGLPVVFHVREPGDDPEANSAWPAAWQVLRESNAAEHGGAAHYFQGDVTTAKALVDEGFMVSFARPLLRLRRLQEAAAILPMDRIVLESDSYPQPFKKDRMKWTEPWHLSEVASKLAEIRGMTVQDVMERTSENALTMLGDRSDAARKLLEN
jgi:TatD DNase family protein